MLFSVDRDSSIYANATERSCIPIHFSDYLNHHLKILSATSSKICKYSYCRNVLLPRDSSTG